MTSDSSKMPELLPDVLQLVFQQLACDREALLNINLTCRAWRSLALPSVYQVVDISSHNNGRLPQFENDTMPIVYAHYHRSYRPRNLLSRQRAFLRLMTEKPHLASYVKSFTWTFIWRENWDYEWDELTDIDRQTWTVFSEMANVTRLDLGSLHDVDDDGYIRQNPSTLFPQVRDLRLLGWMHRGLVKAILTSLHPGKLQSLKLDYLLDEGALPEGETISSDFAIKAAHNANATSTGGRYPSPDGISSSNIIHDDLFMRQETGRAYIFPGPMWLPLNLLSSYSLDSLTHLQVKVPPFEMKADLRSYLTLFRQTALFLIKVNETLESLNIVFGESLSLYEEHLEDGCRTMRHYRSACYRPWCIKMAKLFIEQQLAALNEHAFPRLEKIRFEGFHLLKNASPHDADKADLASVLQSIRYCRFSDATFIDISSVDSDQHSFLGYERNEDGDGRFTEFLANS